ncbi:hypothetical protein M011DRAFT_458196 [Sporormia fimetaria CBS 119925]|uniref:Uncharacterized protein n=1 Tax=Sporormia fimetaria CBS 119925 TaxID=1340428 RepID=A0A6A6VCA1_9PLEO|nr:hypothetical protein M011DRAFT_458196 [Sporormia fimetaria CBS 119925]
MSTSEPHESPSRPRQHRPKRTPRAAQNGPNPNNITLLKRGQKIPQENNGRRGPSTMAPMVSSLQALDLSVGVMGLKEDINGGAQSEGGGGASGHLAAPKGTPRRPSNRAVPKAIPGASLTDTELGAAKVSATPTKAQAYAGPTFHSSPAPSELPIPKFKSKSVPAKTRAGIPNPFHVSPGEGSPPSPPSPSPAALPVQSNNENTNLNLLFQADREERARNSSAGAIPHSSLPFAARITNHSHHHPNPFPPHGVQNPGPFPRGNVGPFPTAHPRDSESRNPAGAVFPIELDGASKGQNAPHAAGPQTTYQSSRSPVPLDREKMAMTSNHIPDPFNRPSANGRQSGPNHHEQHMFNHPRAADRAPLHPVSRIRDGSSAFHSPSGSSVPGPLSESAPAATISSPQNASRNGAVVPKPEASKRNSGLHASAVPATATGPRLSSMSAALPSQGRPVADTKANDATDPSGIRRGSTPNIAYARQHPFRGHGTQQRGFATRPNNHGQANNGRSASSTTAPRPAAPLKPFVPLSVQAKRFSAPGKVPTPSATPASNGEVSRDAGSTTDVDDSEQSQAPNTPANKGNLAATSTGGTSAPGIIPTQPDTPESSALRDNSSLEQRFKQLLQISGPS